MSKASVSSVTGIHSVDGSRERHVTSLRKAVAGTGTCPVTAVNVGEWLICEYPARALVVTVMGGGKLAWRIRSTEATPAL